MSAGASKRYAIVIDTSKCFDCKACMIACKVENAVPEGFWRNWVRHTGGLNGRRTHYQPGQCMQCDEPSCVAACPVGATWRRKDGLVVIDQTRCIGCGNCVTACPYAARYRHPETRTADKCDFCAHRLKRGEEPACVETCPTKARVFGDLNDPQSRVSELIKLEKLVQVVSPVVDTKPAIYYSAGTLPLDWPVEPSLPGNVYMSRAFWKTTK
ncbi:MAG: 4Fe-4S ferredoxin [Deltaproteobacteria bacterium HGW-Deltaproteobacteria-15]|jgi:tetrathionate reductase subunit B|nr:MAG: 4Fe-4S ferredoxin [Deltaproteobacteria bacterium HGW-Deltaproteobacteria-15]